jgi:hypothetical protein
MRRTKIKNAEQLKRLTLSEAKKAFLQHCKIKNLSEKTIKYYSEDKVKCFRIYCCAPEKAV